MITQEMIAQLKGKVENDTKKEFTVPELIDEIVSRYHAKELTMIREIREEMDAYETDHNTSSGLFKKTQVMDARIQDIFQEFYALSSELKHHFEKEEREVFPLMVASYDMVEGASDRSDRGAGMDSQEENRGGKLFLQREFQGHDPALLREIQRLEKEHGQTEEHIQEIIRLSDHYGYKARDVRLASIYQKMQICFADLSEHREREEMELSERDW